MSILKIHFKQFNHFQKYYNVLILKKLQFINNFRIAVVFLLGIKAMKMHTGLKTVIKSLQCFMLKNYSYLNTSYQIPQNVRSYENQKNHYLQYMDNAFQQEQLKRLFEEGKKFQMINKSLETNSEVLRELDDIVIEEFNRNANDFIQSINDYYLISKKLWDTKQFNRSFTYIQRALQLAEVYRGTTHKEFYQCLDFVGQHLLAQGRLFEAQFYFERALKCVVQDKGPFHEDVVHFQKQLAYMYSLQGKLKMAQEIYNEALQIQQKHNPLYCVETLDTILRLNLIQQKQGVNKNQIKEDLKWILSQVKVSSGDQKSQQFKLQVIYEQALVNISEKDYEEGEKLLVDYLSQQDNEDLYVEAKLNLGYIEMMRKNYQKSLEIYEDCKKRISHPKSIKYQNAAQQQQKIQDSLRQN